MWMAVLRHRTNLLTMSDKIVGLVRKLERWRGQVDGGNLDMFPTFDEFLTENELNWDVTKK